MRTYYVLIYLLPCFSIVVFIRTHGEINIMKNVTTKDEIPIPEPTLVSVKQMAKASPALSESFIRKLLFNRHKNGLFDSGAIIRVGHRVFLDQGLFMKWIVDRSKGLVHD